MCSGVWMLVANMQPICIGSLLRSSAPGFRPAWYPMTTMKPIVLVHGMYFGGWCWRKVAAPLRSAGHAVYAPSLTGCGDRVHLSRPGITIDTLGHDIGNLLRYEDLRDVTLVATSSGGMAAARAAEL